MEESLPKSTRLKPQALVPWAFAAAIATTALALALTHPAGGTTTKLQLPNAVTAQNCLAVAKDANLLKTKMTTPRLGQYYAAWVTKLGGNQPTRSTLFNAGIAVAVCLR